MKLSRIYLAIGALVLASLACQALSGGGSRDVDDAPSSNDTATLQPQEAQSTLPANNDSNSTVETDFPMTDDAFNVMDTGNGSILYYTKLSAQQAMDFYRSEYTARGYKEREVATVVSEGTFSMIFDGDPSGKAVVVQSVDMGDGSRTISVRLEDV